MFNQSVDQRLSEWVNLRKNLDESNDPLQEVWDFWHRAPFIPHNKNIDPYYQQSWPTPWQIIVDNKYDEFTRALMIGWTLKLTNKFKDSKIELRTFVEGDTHKEYNLIFVNDNWVINLDDQGPVSTLNLTDKISLKNLIELKSPR